jgi:hypothetical protein
MEINEDILICSSDIVNTNTPKLHVINMINNILGTNSEIVESNQKEIIQILKTELEQNYFQSGQHYYRKRGISHGCSNICNISRNIYAIYET